MQAIIKPRKIVEEIDGERVEYADLMWLLSATDVFGPSEEGYWKDLDDSFQLPIFKRERDRVKRVRERGNVPLLAPLRLCDELVRLLPCEHGRQRGQLRRVLVEWLRAGL